jgi:hypothetical protein
MQAGEAWAEPPGGDLEDPEKDEEVVVPVEAAPTEEHLSKDTPPAAMPAEGGAPAEKGSPVEKNAPVEEGARAVEDTVPEKGAPAEEAAPAMEAEDAEDAISEKEMVVDVEGEEFWEDDEPGVQEEVPEGAALEVTEEEVTEETLNAAFEAVLAAKELCRPAEERLRNYTRKLMKLVKLLDALEEGLSVAESEIETLEQTMLQKMEAASASRAEAAAIQSAMYGDDGSGMGAQKAVINAQAAVDAERQELDEVRLARDVAAAVLRALPHATTPLRAAAALEVAKV